MKILLPFQDPYNRPLTHPVVSGGTEQFCKSIKNNFDTTIYQVPIEQINKKIWPKNSDKIEISTNIINLAEQINADIIVCNFAQAIYNNQTIYCCFKNSS